MQNETRPERPYMPEKIGIYLMQKSGPNNQIAVCDSGWQALMIAGTLNDVYSPDRKQYTTFELNVDGTLTNWENPVEYTYETMEAYRLAENKWREELSAWCKAMDAKRNALPRMIYHEGNAYRMRDGVLETAPIIHDPEAYICDGHQTTNGAIGSTEYCDGSCKAPLKPDVDEDAWAEATAIDPEDVQLIDVLRKGGFTVRICNMVGR